jgi:hypothetical protein
LNVELNWKIVLAKEKINQKKKGQTEKKKKLWLKDEIKSKKTSTKRRGKKLKIKKIRIEMKTKIKENVIEGLNWKTKTSIKRIKTK